MPFGVARTAALAAVRVSSHRSLVWLTMPLVLPRPARHLSATEAANLIDSRGTRRLVHVENPAQPALIDGDNGPPLGAAVLTLGEDRLGPGPVRAGRRSRRSPPALGRLAVDRHRAPALGELAACATDPVPGRVGPRPLEGGGGAPRTAPLLSCNPTVRPPCRLAA